MIDTPKLRPMSSPTSRRTAGFVLIEALVALVIIALGLLAVSRLQLASLGGAGEAKARSEAATCAQKLIEEKRNILLAASYSGLSSIAPGSCNSGIAGSTGYTVTFTTTANATIRETLVDATTTWSDRNGTQELYLNTRIAWDDPAGSVRAQQNIKTTLISPTGQAERCSSSISGCTGLTGGTAGAGGTSIRTDGSGGTYLYKDATGLLYLPPDSNGNPQSFTTITGKVYFDQSVASNKIPISSHVRVRLSSEGECLYNNAATDTAANSAGGGAFTYFKYTCYVGPGWYGNVGVVVDDSASSNEKRANVCIGDPGYNGGVSDGTLISPHSDIAATRSYRGFKSSGTSFLSTGVMGGRHYGVNDDGASTRAAPYDGLPIPSQYQPTYYSTVTAGGATDYFEQNFLYTYLSGNNDSCESKMNVAGVFARNAGQYVCINPDDDPSGPQCPPIWPGFEDQVGSGGGSINYTLTVATAGTSGATGTVAITSPSALSCGTGCTTSYPSATSVTMTATPGSGSVFASWSGCTSTSGNTCTVVVSSSTTVTANFIPASSADTLTVTLGGTGTGVVTSSPSGINCGTSCTAAYATVTTVTLTAAPTSGSTFTGWSGACTGTSTTCTVSVSGATSVTASFAAAAAGTLTVTKSGTGSGTVTSSPSGISCGSTCSASFGVGTTVTLTAAPTAGTSFAGWSGACSGTGACTVAITGGTQTVTAVFNQNTSCITTVKGKALSNGDTVTATPPGTTCTTSSNNSNYTCSISLPLGTNFTLTDVSASLGTSTKALNANCGNQTSVNF